MGIEPERDGADHARVLSGAPENDAAGSAEADPEDSAGTETDFYYDGPYLVFTAAYHLRRGFCCNSGCRHCPYR